MTRLRFAPGRRFASEVLDDPSVDPAVRARSLADVARSNTLFGGCSAVLAEFRRALPAPGTAASLLDIGTGLADILVEARALARRRGIRLTTIGLDEAESLLPIIAGRTDAAVRADALRLPFRSRSIDIVMASQVLHHFTDAEAVALIREMHRVARRRVIVSDLRRSWVAAAGLWLVSFPLGFHPVSRHDGVVSVLRGFTASELLGMVRDAIGVTPVVRARRGFRVTASWSPTPTPELT